VRTPALVLLAVLAAAAVAVAVEGDDDPVARTETRPPVVILVLDEMPTDVLLTPGGEIDAHRYPNFAALAGTSTWFRNGHAVFDSTFGAVPAILDGRMPHPFRAADVRLHQPSIFHLMHGLGYDVIKVESATALCPPRICPGARTRRPGVLSRLAGSGRPARLHRWIGAIRDRPRPTFYFHHALLPHEPWIYLPSGRQNRPSGEDPVPGINKPGGFHDRGLTDFNHLRHLLQVGFTDRELGRLVRRLRRTGLFDRALLVVLADHGYSFEMNVPGRRRARDSNVEELAPVPFFVKAPGQTEGAVSDSVVRTLDVVPTVADLLGVQVTWRNAGTSAFSPIAQEREAIALPARGFRRLVAIDREGFERRRARIRAARARTFGTGRHSALVFGDPWESAYRIGPHRELLGRRVADVAPASGGPHAELANAELLADVDPHDEIFPTRLAGRIEGGAPGDVRDLAAAVNGRIRAVGRSFHLRGRRPEFFSMMVPESALREGRNEVELLEVSPSGKLQRGLTP
jgi:Sulfatase